MIYVTSDLHGYSLEKIKEMFSKVGFSDDDFCFVLGDVIDRGKDGIEILKWLMTKPNMELILGNHEAMMLACEFLFDEITEESISKITGNKLDIYLLWEQNGARPTINALHSLEPNEIKYILEYLHEAPLYETVSVNGKDFLLTHSGLKNFDKNKSISKYSNEDFLWNRPKIDDRYFDDVITVFGHTPTIYYGEEYKGKAVVTDTWIDIDTGASCGFSPMLLRLDDLKEFYF
ncbi:MAG: metallophosphoesterase [Ruminococcus sp.]|nr:metallophosphoesterase [Ruminococcus sp.]